MKLSPPPSTPEVVRLLAGLLSGADLHESDDSYVLTSEPVLAKDGGTDYTFLCDSVSQCIEESPFDGFIVEEFSLSASCGIGAPANTAVLAVFRGEMAMAEVSYELDSSEDESPGSITQIQFLGDDPAPFLGLIETKRQRLSNALRELDEKMAALKLRIVG